MSEPAIGEVRALGPAGLTYRWVVCKRCNDPYWELSASRRRTCRQCKYGRPNPFA